MAKIIREKYESGVLVAREIETEGRDAIQIAKLCAQIVIALSVLTIAVVNVRDSLTYSDMAESSEMIGVTCPAPTFSS